MAETLAYLFECQFNDGTTLKQTQEDVSPSTPGKNCFYDVLQKMDDVVAFSLLSENHENAIAVDLRDGHFECNGVTFHIHSSEHLPPNAKRRLIYFRRHTHHTSPQGQSHEVAFHLGWQTTINGKNFQQTIEVD